MSTFEQAGHAQILAFQGQLGLSRLLADTIHNFIVKYFSHSAPV